MEAYLSELTDFEIDETSEDDDKYKGVLATQIQSLI